MEENKEMVEEKVEVKSKKTKKKKSVVARVFDFIISVIVFGILAVWLYDFYNVYNEKDPQLCLKEETHEYEDGTTEVCTGAGYKVYKYNRKSIEGLEFGPFWMEERQ